MGTAASALWLIQFTLFRRFSVIMSPLLVLLGLVAVASAGSPYKDCGSKSKITDIDINGCTRPPCSPLSSSNFPAWLGPLILIGLVKRLSGPNEADYFQSNLPQTLPITIPCFDVVFLD